MFITAKQITKLKNLLGDDSVYTDPISLAMNGYDCSSSRHQPDIVLQIKQLSLLEPTICLLAREKIPFIVRAAATNHAGSCSAVKGGAIININALSGIEYIDTANGYADVLPGTVTGHLQNELNKLGFFYAPDPASEQVCTLGGNLAQNASGARCMKYGNTADNILQIEFITPDGQIAVLRHDGPGPDWLGLVAGSEGTLGIIKRMRAKILPCPKHIKTFLATFPSLESCVQTVTDLTARGLIPRCVEAMDRLTIQAVENFTHAGYPAAEALLILELDGELAAIKKEATLLEEICQKNQCQTFTAARNETEREKLWQGRRAAYSAMACLAPNVVVGDGTVARSELPRTLQQIREIITKYGITASLLFHAGDGNFHPQLVFDASNLIQNQCVQKAVQEILKICIAHQGTLSGEHGIGTEKRALMAYQYSRETLRLFKQIKQAFDPKNLANPDKIIPVGFEDKEGPEISLSANVASLQQQIRQRFAQYIPSLITGKNTHAYQTEAAPLSTEFLQNIVDIDTANYTATVQTGISVKDLLQILHKQGLYARLPLDYTGTLGGLVATKAAPDFISQIIGVQAILPNAEAVQYGGKLMKNAAGYNLCRLFAGSWGALGIITQITFKIYATPQPPAALIPRQAVAADTLFQATKKEIDPQGLFLSPAFDKEIVWQNTK